MPAKLTNFARQLRTNSTDTERLLWQHLRAGRFGGSKFKRQQPLGNYVVDFVCFEARLILELDGGQHADQEEADKIRDQWLKSQGFQVLRFWNNEVLTNLEGVMQCVHVALSPSPQPSPVKGEGANQGCAASLLIGSEDENLQCETLSPLAGEGRGEVD